MLVAVEGLAVGWMVVWRGMIDAIAHAHDRTLHDDGAEFHAVVVCRCERHASHEEGSGEKDDRTAAREQAGDHLNTEEHCVVVGHRRDQCELAAEEHDGAEGEQVGRDV